MKRIFNIAGLCIPGEQYLIPTFKRCPEIDRLKEAKQYFVIHAADNPQKQILSYMDRTNTTEGRLVVFDRRKDKSRHEKIRWKVVDIEGNKIHTVWC
jgi:peptide deformylase